MKTNDLTARERAKCRTFVRRAEAMIARGEALTERQAQLLASARAVLASDPGLIERRTARSTGTTIALYREPDGGWEVGEPNVRYTTICEDHAGIVGHATLAVAKAWMASPETWCPICSGADAASCSEPARARAAEYARKGQKP